MVYFTLIRGKDRSYWLPGNRVKELIMKSKIVYSPLAQCVMDCGNIKQEVIQQTIEKGEVNFKESDTHSIPYPSYVIEGTISGGDKLKITIGVHDSIAEIKIITYPDIQKVSCLCK